MLRLDGGRLQYCNGKNWVQVTGHDIVENSQQNPGKKNIVHFNEHFNRGFGDIRPLVLGNFISINKIDDKLLLNLGAKFQR